MAGEMRLDSELDNLLDSALSDFDAQKEKEKEVHTQQVDESAQLSAAAADSGQQFSFNFDQMRESLSFLQNNPQLNSEISEQNPELFQATQKALELFTESLDRFQDRGNSFNAEEFLSDVFSGLNSDSKEPFSAFIKNTFGNMVTKQLMYPGLKEIHDTIPKWLEDNKQTVAEDVLKRTKAQHELLKQIITEYDSEKDSDSEQVKSERQRRIIDLIGNMQGLGELPKDLLGQDTIFPENDNVPPECAQQ